MRLSRQRQANTSEKLVAKAQKAKERRMIGRRSLSLARWHSARENEFRRLNSDELFPCMQRFDMRRF
ncbi:hypothetical protein TB1_020206 [Malus domestica]